MHLFSSGLGIVIAVVALWGTAQQVWSDSSSDPMEKEGALVHEFLDADTTIRVRGRVLDAHGDPVAGVQVVVRPQAAHHVGLDEATSAQEAAVTDAAGNFVLPGLLPGNYAVVALHAQHPPGIAQVLITPPRCGDENDVRIVLDNTDLLIPA